MSTKERSRTSGAVGCGIRSMLEENAHNCRKGNGKNQAWQTENLPPISRAKITTRMQAQAAPRNLRGNYRFKLLHYHIDNNCFTASPGE